MLGDNIRRLRKEKNISINKLSKMTGISLGYLSDIENNKAKNPTMEIINKISIALGTTTKDLINYNNVCFDNLFKLCNDANISLDELGEILSLNSLSLEMIKDGVLPDDNSLDLIANYFNVNKEYLIENKYSFENINKNTDFKYEKVNNNDKKNELITTNMVIDRLIQEELIKDENIDDNIANMLLNTLKIDLAIKLNKNKTNEKED